MVPKPLRNAHSMLSDSSRPFSLLMQLTPVQPAEDDSRDRYEFIDVILAYHKGDRSLSGRFRAAYNDACTRLDRLLERFDHRMPLAAIIPAPHNEWKIQIMTPRWDAFDNSYYGIEFQHAWYALHRLMRVLDSAQTPLFQTLTLADMPVDVLARIGTFLDLQSTRSLSVTNNYLRSAFVDQVRQHAKVTLWYNNAYLSPAILSAMRSEIRAPDNVFGLSLACFWSWVRHRIRMDECDCVRSLTVVNRWLWARAVYSELSWTHMRRDIHAWSTSLEGAMLSFTALRQLRLVHVMLTKDIIRRLAAHGCLRQLDLRGCGMPLSDGVGFLPKLFRIRHLQLDWDSHSSMEIACAQTILGLTPNVWHLTLGARAARVRLGVSFYSDWQSPPLRNLRTLVLRDVDGGLVLDILRRCRSPFLQTFAIRLATPLSTRDCDRILSLLGRRSTSLTSLVLDGGIDSDVDFLTYLAFLLPNLHDLALMPRNPNQVRPSPHIWKASCFEVADQLTGLADLERFCANFDYRETISPSWLDRAGLSPTGDRDGLEVGRQTVLAYAASLPRLRSFVLTGKDVSYAADIVRIAAHPGYEIVDLAKIHYSSGERPWWSMG